MRATSSLTICSMSGCNSGSPPAIETIGVPDSRDGAQDVVDRQPLAQYLGRVLDLSAARAGQVASEERLDLDDEGVVLGLFNPVPHKMGTDSDVLTKWDWHQRTCVGREKRTVSSVPSLLAQPYRPERAEGVDDFLDENVWRRCTGGEADASSRLRANRAPALRRPLSSSARQPSRVATSTSRAVFEEFAEPTTSMRSQRWAIWRTASWRFWVA